MSHTHGRASDGARTRSRRRRRGVVALGLMAALLAIAAVPALAHQTITQLPGDGSYATMIESHTRIYVCDMDSDSNRAYVRRVVGGVVLEPVYDYNGASDGCGLVDINPNTLDSYNICVQNEGCATPIYRSQF